MYCNSKSILDLVGYCTHFRSNNVAINITYSSIIRPSCLFSLKIRPMYLQFVNVHEILIQLLSLIVTFFVWNKRTVTKQINNVWYKKVTDHENSVMSWIDLCYLYYLSIIYIYIIFNYSNFHNNHHNISTSRSTSDVSSPPRSQSSRRWCASGARRSGRCSSRWPEARQGEHNGRAGRGRLGRLDDLENNNVNKFEVNHGKNNDLDGFMVDLWFMIQLQDKLIYLLSTFNSN